MTKITKAQILETGFTASIWGEQVIVSRVCVICRKAIGKKKYDENLAIIESDRVPEDDSYHICCKCVRVTQRQLSCLNDMPLKDMPKYLADPNVFMRKRALKRLKGQ